MVKEIPKEPSRIFFKYFLIFLILNITFSVIVYVLSPEQVPSKLTRQGFENYRSKIYVLSPVLHQLILLVIGLVFYKILPLTLKIYPNFLQKVYTNLSGILLGINPTGLKIEVLISKYISVLILTISVLLIPFNFIMLGFSLKFSNLSTYLTIFIILSVILIIPLFRIFSKKLQ